jgi:hypothetical protein
MVHSPVYHGFIPTARTLSQDMGRGKVGLLRPQSRFLAGCKIEGRMGWQYKDVTKRVGIGPGSKNWKKRLMARVGRGIEVEAGVSKTWGA